MVPDSIRMLGWHARGLWKSVTDLPDGSWCFACVSLPVYFAIVCALCVRVGFATDAAVDYLREIKPLLRDKCYVCHGVLRQEAGLRVDTANYLRAGGESGSPINPSDPDNSLLMKRLTAADPSERMPQEAAPLTPEELDKLRRWIAAGAPGPENEQPQPDPRQHWAFRPPVRPPVPNVEHREWVANPIDAFVVHSYEKLGLQPQPVAEPATLLRRLFLDLVGLPPSEEQLQEFLEDSSEDAWYRWVERLLSSPQYGERWARHWMDIWRYSDWYGRRMVPDVWNSAPQIWRWRDWIVRSLNQDKGYDRMILEMLAGDEAAPTDPEVVVATGFLVRNWYALNPNDWMRANVEHTAKAFLGLTFNCAHCHDHKYDPISQLDYFRFRAFFEPLGLRQDRVPGEADPGPFEEYQYSKVRRIQRLGMVRVYDKKPDAPTWFYTGGDERNRKAELGSITPGLPSVFGQELEIEPIELPPAAWYPALQPWFKETLLREADARIAAARASMEAIANQQASEQSHFNALYQQFQQQLSQWSNEAQHPWFGQPVLLIDGQKGRRILYRWLPYDFPVADHLRVDVDLSLLADEHVNLQLMQDASRGLTALYVGFRRGEVFAYQPGTFHEIKIGSYMRDTPVVLQLVLAIDCANDVARLTIHQSGQDRPVVEATPIALNGWNTSRAPRQPLAIDVRAGSIAAVKRLGLVSENGTSSDASSDSGLLDVRFDQLPYLPGLDVVGLDGWQEFSGGEVGGQSRVTWALGGAAEAVTFEHQQTKLLWRAAQEQVLRLQAHSELLAAEAKRHSVQLRLEAEERRCTDCQAAPDPELVRRAALAEHQALLAEAHAQYNRAWQQWLALVVKEQPDGQADKKRAEALQQLVERAARWRTVGEEYHLGGAPKSFTALSPQYPRQSTGRRLALASWIAAPHNPLTARVAINHIWMRHFGEPLVDTVFDFGTNGAKPVYPELLDWLACELIESGYSMKHIHRLITTSRTYRLTSSMRGGEANQRRDPDNRYLWRFRVGRMEAETVRDSVLAAAGVLDRAMGGQELENSEALTTFRRSLYYSCHPEVGGKSPIGEWFDAPDPNECYRRTRTIVPQQALVLTNSEWIHRMSQRLAERLWNECRGWRDEAMSRFVQRAFRVILSRDPSSEEIKVCLEWLHSGEWQGQTDSEAVLAKRRTSLVKALFNHNDFVAIR